ncbi:hypothetical protein ACIBFB_07155 [Nocardiopsis sp. NPDC050513]|uniref:hypothetical protein n=1 Tax=Nocardiopsis sp. NPDC050513 TaxID=3364338 RepID=UPI003795303C
MADPGITRLVGDALLPNRLTPLHRDVRSQQEQTEADVRMAYAAEARVRDFAGKFVANVAQENPDLTAAAEERRNQVLGDVEAMRGEFVLGVYRRQAWLEGVARPGPGVSKRHLHDALDKNTRDAAEDRREFHRRLSEAERSVHPDPSFREPLVPPAAEPSGTRAASAVTPPPHAALHNRPRQQTPTRGTGADAASEQRKAPGRNGPARSTVRAAETRQRRNGSEHRGRARP